jgi:hypothetical protein
LTENDEFQEVEKPTSRPLKSPLACAVMNPSLSRGGGVNVLAEPKTRASGSKDRVALALSPFAAAHIYVAFVVLGLY